MSVDDKREVAETETENGTTTIAPSKKQKTSRHCKRFWWIYVIAFCCAVVLVVCLVIFVGVPKIAQGKVNDAKLDIQGVNILDTESEAYLLQINSTITTDGKTKADITSFEGDMYLEDAEGQPTFATLEFPETNGDKHQIVNVSQHLDIKNLDAFTQFNVWFALNDTLRVTVKGKPKVKPHGLDRSYGVTFKKTVEMKGLNLFNGTKIIDGHISTSPSVKRNFNGTAEIPNQSYFTLDIGNVSFTNFADDKEVGTIFINNLILHPGINTVNITAEMDQATIINLVRSPAYCKDGIIPFKLQGKTVENHGQDISYFRTALASGNQTVPIDIGGIIEKDQGFSLGCAK